MSGPAPSRRRRADHLLIALAGLAVLVACGLVARHGTVGPAERHVFHPLVQLAPAQAHNSQEKSR